MFRIDRATSDHVDGLIVLESMLFADDAGRHDTFVDTTWPEREGRKDFERLLADPACIVLVAYDEERLIGSLVGYWSPSSSTRLPMRYAILRSMYVRAEHRRSGAGSALTERFLAWATDNGCVEAHVDSYVANVPAQRFYQHHGFSRRSLSRVRPL